MKQNHWTENFFNKLYWELFMKRTPEKVKQEVSLIKEVLGYNPHSVLDVCCGVGDILQELASDGKVKTMGIEWSDDYVNNRYISTVVNGDACEKNTDEKFDLVLNWFSSFAYFDDENNKKMLQHCFNATQNIFIMEYFNSFNIMLNFKENLSYEKLLNEVLWKIDRSTNLNPETREMEQRWVFTNGVETYEHNTKTKLYFPDEIVKMLKSAGFSKVEVFSHGGEDVNLLKLNNPRLIFKAYR